MSLQTEIAEYRKQHAYGFVVVSGDAVAGWVFSLENAAGWQPGCIAIAPNGREWAAAGGNDYDGATAWETRQ